jgi:hypothetical protein
MVNMPYRSTKVKEESMASKKKDLTTATSEQTTAAAMPTSPADEGKTPELAPTPDNAPAESFQFVEATSAEIQVAEGVVIGDDVHYVMPNGKHRPAKVVEVWKQLNGAHEGLPIEGGIVNLQVFTDSSNDQDPTQSSGFNERVATGLLWATSVRHSAEHLPGTWHWIELG